MQAVSAPRPRSVPGQPVSDPYVTGDVRLIHDFPSDALQNQRDVVVFLPPGYDAQDSRRYPVVYLQDGQNVFDASTSAFGEWHLDETGQALMEQHRMQDVIMVGVYNTPQRMDEYTPVTDPQYGGGQADKYDSFLIQELKPWVDSHYRTQADATHTAIMGSSLGGLVALYSGWKHPDVFGMVGALSPSLWWADEELSKAMAADKPGAQPDRVWLDIGTEEGSDPAATVADTRRMHDVLRQRGYVDEQNLFYREVPGGQHNEASWADRGGDVLMHLFPGGD